MLHQSVQARKLQLISGSAKLIKWYCEAVHHCSMAVRVQFEGNNEVGVFSKLTNAYCLVAIGGSANFYR